MGNADRQQGLLLVDGLLQRPVVRGPIKILAKAAVRARRWISSTEAWPPSWL